MISDHEVFDLLTHHGITDEHLIRQLLIRIGEDPQREGLQDTPARFLKALKHHSAGYTERPEDVLKVFTDGAKGYDQIICQRNIRVFSHCEHHIAPFFGVAHVAYIPKKEIVGLSKITRLVRIYMQRLQVQERLTNQIADALQYHLKPQGVGVVLRCRHTCMEGRGVLEPNTVTVTSALRGAILREDSARAEFMALANTD